MERWIEVQCDLGTGNIGFRMFIINEMRNNGLFIFNKYFTKDFNEISIISDTITNFYLE